ncbi:Cytosine/adenosine deaminase or related metal-dependent hydrolase [Geosmithia morbida]|uniref:Cytosine/adenosine deaminase or related metal-dependent hydrolase n=1 Tax=Geosmithia morbida TaxID=1094350 RepID=A0A9P4YYH8_9HYPO|nr:Cytosine/adenosine deaminase or related metal-dependent hydrolase [Geosmithia morbida]KAF4124119.1 Cytosine/adenosine deaminase or related metal-dependent hydrolase [Geosmithia morbida]
MTECTIFHGATIITVNPQRETIQNGYIRVDARRITAIGKGRYPAEASLPPGTREIDCRGKIIIPGLINTHAHLVQSILRGLAEDLPLHNWLCDAVWPLEASFEDYDGYHAARLTVAEMLKTGTTCFLDPMITYRAGFDNVCEAVGGMGIRACLGKLVKFAETNRQLSISDPRDADLLAMSTPELLRAHGQHHGSYDGRIHVWAAAGTPRGVPISHYRDLGQTCAAGGISITMHCAEAPRDRTIYHETYGCSAMEFVRDAGLCAQVQVQGQDDGKTGAVSEGEGSRPPSHNLVLAHMVNLDPDVDIPLLASTGTSVAHNPTSNLKLASGVAPVPAMLSHTPDAVNVSLGTDGAPCSNHYDMIREMHLAGILHKGVNGDARLIPAELALEMATINGARALGLADDVGSLEVGKMADVVVIDPGIGAAPWVPTSDDEADGTTGGTGNGNGSERVTIRGVSAATTVVHGCTGRDVDMTMVNGVMVVEGGRLLKVEESEVVSRAREAARGVIDRCSPQA